MTPRPRSAFTDADVEAALGAYILHGANHGPKAVVNDLMTAVLDAVAPAIAARAGAQCRARVEALCESAEQRLDEPRLWTSEIRAALA